MSNTNNNLSNNNSSILPEYKMFNEIKNDERGLLFKNGSYVKTLKSGKHFLFPFSGNYIKIMNINKYFITDKNLNIFLNDKELINELLIIDIKDYEIGLHYEDGHFYNLLTAGRYAFWKILMKHEVIQIDTRNPKVSNDIDKSIFSSTLMAGKFSLFEIASYEKGLLFYDGVFQELLVSGKYYFWKSSISITLQKVDMRQLQLDISGQEIMTEDKISLRINFVCHYKIIDPIKALLNINSYQEQIYILLQLILREYVGTLKLDDLLCKKEEVATFILTKLKEKSDVFGIEFIFAGLKDIILPGEMKTILNQVLEAEKKAQANLIMRREETASTRSLLNTVKIMENNPILLRLKELEYIEKICSKIDKVNLLGSGNLLDQLGNLFISKEKN